MGERLVSLHLDKMVCILTIDHILLNIDTIFFLQTSNDGSKTDKLTAAENQTMVELAEHRARKLRQQLEEKTEQLSECKEELDKKQEATGGNYRSST